MNDYKYYESVFDDEIRKAHYFIGLHKKAEKLQRKLE